MVMPPSVPGFATLLPVLGAGARSELGSESDAEGAAAADGGAIGVPSDGTPGAAIGAAVGLAVAAGLVPVCDKAIPPIATDRGRATQE